MNKEINLEAFLIENFDDFKGLSKEIMLSMVSGHIYLNKYECISLAENSFLMAKAFLLITSLEYNKIEKLHL